MESVRRSTRIAARPRVVWSSSTHSRTTRPDGRRGPRKFTLFPKLPLELQHAILSFACEAQRKEKRFLRVAPNTNDDMRQEKANGSPLAQVPLRIYPTMGHALVPSMMHVCSYSRSLKLKSYTLLPCADFENRMVLHNKFTYVNLDEDIFYFGDIYPAEFKALHALVVLARDKRDLYGFQLDLIKRIKNIAFDWESYSEIMQVRASWLCGVNPDRIIINVRNPIREVDDVPISHMHRMRDIKPGTIRKDLADSILIWTNWLVAFVQDVEKTDYKPPIFEVRDLSTKGTEENSQLDETILDRLVLMASEWGIFL